MTYRAWNLKPLDRAALRELTQAIAEQATEELEYNAQNDEPWSEQKYAAALAAQQKENALLAGVLTARGITDPTEALTLLAGEEELSDPSLLTDMDKACERIWRAIDEGETIVIATVEGDIHDIGKNLVALMLKNYGFRVVDLGKDVPKEDIVQAAIDEKADIIALSALMTTTMMRMKDVVELVKEKQLKTKVIIGGAVITQSYADEIGADGYSKDAADAVRLVQRLLGLSL